MKKILIIIVTINLIIIGGFLIVRSNNSNGYDPAILLEEESNTNDSYQSNEADNFLEKPKVEEEIPTAKQTYQLTKGSYQVPDQIQPGKYQVEYIEGSGKVIVATEGGSVDYEMSDASAQVPTLTLRMNSKVEITNDLYVKIVPKI